MVFSMAHAYYITPSVVDRDINFVWRNHSSSITSRGDACISCTTQDLFPLLMSSWAFVWPLFLKVSHFNFLLYVWPECLHTLIESVPVDRIAIKVFFGDLDYGWVVEDVKAFRVAPAHVDVVFAAASFKRLVNNCSHTCLSILSDSVLKVPVLKFFHFLNFGVTAERLRVSSYVIYFSHFDKCVGTKAANVRLSYSWLYGCRYFSDWLIKRSYWWWWGLVT